MPLLNIPFDRTNQLGQEIKALLNAYRKVVTDGPLLISVLTDYVDNDGSALTDFQALVDVGAYPTTQAAMDSWNELNSVNAKVTTDAAVSSVQAALLQVCAKHGIV